MNNKQQAAHKRIRHKKAQAQAAAIRHQERIKRDGNTEKWRSLVDEAWTNHETEKDKEYFRKKQEEMDKQLQEIELKRESNSFQIFFLSVIIVMFTLAAYILGAF